tara:strand:- start:1314 stop:1805 length:492 start_codon:yes stop_codon:yes gene_type:complete
MSTLPKIKQFKLTNDDEIICEVLEYESPDNAAILVRGALRVVEQQDFQRGIRFFGFRPWMSFNDNPEVLQTLNSAHVIGEITPEEKLVKLYVDCIADFKKYKGKKKVDVSVDQLQDAVDNLTDEELEQYLDDHMVDNVYDPDVFEKDSADPKIIHFKPRNTVH